jgi:diguanylate cyclase (GGDEF)-like protein
MPTSSTPHRQWIERLGNQLIADALSAQDPLESLERVTAVLHDRFDLVLCGLFLVDPRSGDMQQDTLCGPSFWAHQVGMRWRQERGIVGRCFRTGKPQWVPDVRKDRDYVLADPNVRAEFAIPLRFHGDILGVLNLEARHARQIGPRVRTQLQSLADRIAGVIHLALLGHRLRETSAALVAANKRLSKNAQQLKRLASHDELTKVANRRYFEQALSNTLAQHRRSGEDCAVLLIDIDHFKAYNDRYGHHKGDSTLARVAKSLKSGLHRRTDMIARYGGEEFAALLCGETTVSARIMAERLRQAVDALNIAHTGSPTGRVTVSIGVADTRKAHQRDTLIEAADRGLYAAKRAGRNRTRIGRASGSGRSIRRRTEG